MQWIIDWRGFAATRARMKRPRTFFHSSTAFPRYDLPLTVHVLHANDG